MKSEELLAAIFTIAVIFGVLGLVLLLGYCPRSRMVFKNTCCVCNTEKNVIRLEEVHEKKFNGSSVSTQMTYYLCEDCMLKLCKESKKETAKEEKKDDQSK